MGMIINPYKFAVANTPPDCISDGNTLAWYIADEISTITKDESNRVSKWADYLGSGNDVEQSTDNNKPVWSSDGITFDGSGDNLIRSSGFITTRPQKIYLVVKQLSWANSKVFIDRGSGFHFNQSTASPKIAVYNNIALNDTAHLNTLEIIRYSADTANPTPIKIRVNEYTETSATGWINIGSGIYIGCYNNFTNYINALFCEIIIRKVIDDAEDDAAIYDYLKTKYSIT